LARPAGRTGIVLVTALAAAALHALDAPPAHAAPIDTVVRSALTDFPAIRVAQSNRNVAGYRVDEARAAHLPTFSVDANARVGGAAVSTPLPRARVNLWAGGAIDASVERERQRAASAESLELVTREDVAFATTQAYLRVLRSWRLVGASESNLARHQRLATLFEEIVRIDPGRRFDLVQAQARLQLVRGTLEDRRAELGTARQTLARYYPPPVEPSALGLPAIAEVPPEPVEATSIQDHPAVVAARRELLAVEANARTLRLQRGPRLDLEATGGRDPLSQLVLSWPAFDPTLNAAEQAAVAARLGAEAAVQDAELSVLETLRQAHEDFEAAGRRIAQAGAQVTLASELVNVYFEQFRIGRRNLLDLLSAYAELANGEANLAGSQVDQALARYRIAFAAGRLAPLFEGPLASLPTLPPPEPRRVPPFETAPVTR
jgi:adhesin transport system outer membrane protein